MVMAVGISFLWLGVIFASNNGWFGGFIFSLPDFYNFSFFAMLVPIYICFMFKAREERAVKRFLFPLIAAGGAGFMFATYWIRSYTHALVYVCTFIGLALIGFLLKNDKTVL